LVDPDNFWDDQPDDDEERQIYSVADLGSLASKRPNIEELGTSLTPIVFDEWPYTKRFEWASAEEQHSDAEKILIKSLDAIARLEKLRVLRLTQPPIDVRDEAGDADLFRERQWRYQQLPNRYCSIWFGEARLSNYWRSAQPLSWTPIYLGIVMITAIRGQIIITCEGNRQSSYHTINKYLGSSPNQCVCRKSRTTLGPAGLFPIL
ncbi:hypothetical protein CC86DRAFT_433352, partial [Ophiobolus disseminans]